MNANRKADLQRKLALAPVPKPPAGLAERIKTEIPKRLRFDVERERERLSQSIAFSVRVAASILILISAAYLALNMITRMDQEKPVTAIASKNEAQPIPPPPAEKTAGTAQNLPPSDQARTRAKATAPVAEKELGDKYAGVAQAPSAAAVEERAGSAGASRQATGALADERDALQKPAKLASRRATEEKKQVAPAVAALPEPEVNAMSKVAAAPTAAMDRAEVASPPEMTTSPISGKVMVRSGNEVRDATLSNSNMNVKLVPWKDASRETKLEILKTELARGGDVQAIIRAAREAGLNEFADSIEKH